MKLSAKAAAALLCPFDCWMRLCILVGLCCVNVNTTTLVPGRCQTYGRYVAVVSQDSLGLTPQADGLFPSAAPCFVDAVLITHSSFATHTASPCSTRSNISVRERPQITNTTTRIQEAACDAAAAQARDPGGPQARRPLCRCRTTAPPPVCRACRGAPPMYHHPSDTQILLCAAAPDSAWPHAGADVISQGASRSAIIATCMSDCTAAF